MKIFTTIFLFAAVLCPLNIHAQETVGDATDAETRKLLEALGRLKVSGYIHAQYVQSQISRDELTGGGGSRNQDQFAVRRGRLKFAYRAAPTAQAVVAIDASSSGTVLKDAYVELTEPWTSWKNTLTAGQFNWPFGFEIMYSSSSREVPERSRVVRALFPGERDRGVMISGGGLGDRFDYRLAVVNGTGTVASTDLESGKDLVARLGWDFGPLAVGVSGYEGEALVPTASSPAGELFDRSRFGVDFQARTPLPGLKVRGEWITAEEKGRDVAGWYFYAIQNIGKRHQIALRADEYDANRDLPGDAIFTTTLAYSFLWDRHTKLMLALEDPRRERNDPADRAVTARVQYKF